MSGSQAQWWRGGVVYQAYPRSFADGNGNGNGDGINFRCHDRQLRHNPGRGAPAHADPTAPAAKPCAWQEHRDDRSQPEALDCLRRLRRRVDGYADHGGVGVPATTQGTQRDGHALLPPHGGALLTLPISPISPISLIWN